MGGIRTELTADTRTELKKLAQGWAKSARESGFDFEAGWGPDRVQNTEEGYKIVLYAHS